MAYKKRSTSEAFDKLAYRLEAMRTINPNFDFGDGLNVENIDELVQSLRSNLHQYNQILMNADDQRTLIIELEKQAYDVAQRLLGMTMGQYGQDSVEYRRLGGTRKSEIIPTGTRPLTFQPVVENGSEQTNGSTTTGDSTEP